MKFLHRFYQFLLRCFRRNNPRKSRQNIPDLISGDEIIVRGIVRPIFYSKNKLTENAFLPPPRNRKDVSVLRFNYTDANFCKNHSASLEIGNSKYCGLAIILAESINEVNNAGNYALPNGEILSVILKATPDHDNNLPMHADILYSHTLDDDEPKTLMRKIAKDLIKKAKFLSDPNPQIPGWQGQEINRELFVA